MILIVDDFADGARALTHLLRARGFASQAVYCGEDALAAMRETPPAEPLLVILDDMMPGMTGLDVLRAIQADAQIRRAVVVIFSASVDPAREAQARQLGAAGWFEKASTRGRDILCTVQAMAAFYPLAEASARMANPPLFTPQPTTDSVHIE